MCARHERQDVVAARERPGDGQLRGRRAAPAARARSPSTVNGVGDPQLATGGQDAGRDAPAQRVLDLQLGDGSEPAARRRRSERLGWGQCSCPALNPQVGSSHVRSESRCSTTSGSAGHVEARSDAPRSRRTAARHAMPPPDAGGHGRAFASGEQGPGGGGEEGTPAPPRGGGSDAAARRAGRASSSEFEDRCAALTSILAARPRPISGSSLSCPWPRPPHANPLTAVIRLGYQGGFPRRRGLAAARIRRYSCRQQE